MAWMMKMRNSERCFSGDTLSGFSVEFPWKSEDECDDPNHVDPLSLLSCE